VNDSAWFHALRCFAKLLEDRQKFGNQVTPNVCNDESQPKPGQILLVLDPAVDRNENVEGALSVGGAVRGLFGSANPSRPPS